MPSLKARLEKLEALRPSNRERPFLRQWSAAARDGHVDEDVEEACRGAGVTLGGDDMLMVVAYGRNETPGGFVPSIEMTSARHVEDVHELGSVIPPDRVNRIVLVPLEPIGNVPDEPVRPERSPCLA